MGNSIEWGKPWNPVKGLCPHSDRCYYCYMKNFYKRFNMNPELRLDEKTLAHVPKGDRIFVCSNLDLFAEAIPAEWIQAILDRIDQAFAQFSDRDIESYDLNFMFLTKNPMRYKEFNFNNHFMRKHLGVTWDGLAFTAENINILRNYGDNKFVSFEPLLASPEGQSLKGIDWIIIGADSRKGQPKPPKAWADYLIQEARELGIPVFVKSNYGYPVVIQEYPT